MKILKLLLLPLGIFCVTNTIKSQINELDPVTVTASISPLQSSVTGRNLLVIKGEQFSKFPVNSLDELLRYIPGIEIQARGPMGSQSDIVMRGGTFQQVLIIVDGIRINDPNTGHFNTYIPIVPSEIDRIEILKGASSAIYGSEAVGGVINIITKTFAVKQGLRKKQLLAQATGGQYNLVNVQLGGYLQDEELALYVGMISNNSKGQQQRGTKGYFHNNTGSVSFHYHINDYFNVSARSSADVRDFSAQNYYTTFLSDTAAEKVTTYWNHWKFSYNRNKHSISLDAGFKNVKDEYKYNKSTLSNINKSNLWQGLLIDNYQYRENTNLISGIQYLYKKISSNDRGNHQLNQVGAFVQINHKIGTSLFVCPAIRAEYSDKNGWEGVPQLYVSYKLTNAQLRIGAGKTIREADFTERYNNYNKALVTSGRIGNPDLKDERSYSYEAGADYFGIKGLKISGTFFIKYYSELIDYVNTPYFRMPRKVNLIPTGTYALARNLNKITSVGVETDVQYSKKIGKNHEVFGTLGITNISSKTKNVQPSFYISAHANFLANFSIRYSYKGYSISLNGLYKEREPNYEIAINAEVTRNYFVLNGMLSGFIYQNKLSLYIQTDNVLGAKYSDILGTQMPGTWVMGGLKLAL